ISFDYLSTVKNINDPLLKDAFSWQMHVSGHWIWRYQDDETVIDAQITAVDIKTFKLRINDEELLISGHLEGHQLRIETKHQNYKAIVDSNEQHLTLYTEQGSIIIQRFRWNKSDSSAALHKGQLTAPMPATVVAILKSIGDEVKVGERLIVLEAMKMEHTIHAPIDGVLLEIFYTVGAQVSEGAELLSLSESDS
ncbi:MAG: acetyl-CoA carboxylase biotin carboxyl carrier protein subunit, partial [Gammaproteobacteria bacterium]|nr:acetyl-CoA carboxylase biotin carboxyl carrier protein subunit [Gammaproteobacteria bacterium]